MRLMQTAVLCVLAAVAAGCATGGRGTHDAGAGRAGAQETGGAAPATAASAPEPVPIPEGPSLVLAARYGQTDTVRVLLNNGIDVNRRDELQRTALIAAAGEGHEDVMHLLLRHGADVNAHSGDGTTALMAAAGKGDTEALRLLLEAGAEIDARDTHGETALTAAVRFGQADAAEFLLRQHADPNVYRQPELAHRNVYTPLMYAALNAGSTPDDLRIVRALLDAGAVPNLKRSNGETALTMAERHGQELIAAELRREGARDESPYLGLSNEDALLKAVQLADTAKAQELLESAADPNYRDPITGVTPLARAAYLGRQDILRLLIEHGADVNNVPWGLADHRIDASDAPVSERDLMRAVARGDSALLIAVRQRRLDIVQALLEHGARVQLPNREGESPALIAVRRGDSELLRALLAHGLDPNPPARPLAAEYAFVSIAAAEKQQPLLIEAAIAGHAEVVQQLLEKGADPNVRDEQGRTALYWAVTGGNADSVQVLLEHGADAELTTNYGEKPLDVARKSGRQDVVKLLAAQRQNTL